MYLIKMQYLQNVLQKVWILHAHMQIFARKTKTEINAIFEISKSLEGITLANNAPDKDIEDVSKRVFDLYVVVQHRYNQIKKPLFSDSDLWEDTWQAFYQSLKTAYTDGYEHAKENIENNWKEILRMKRIEVLEERNEV